MYLAQHVIVGSLIYMYPNVRSYMLKREHVNVKIILIRYRALVRTSPVNSTMSDPIMEYSLKHSRITVDAQEGARNLRWTGYPTLRGEPMYPSRGYCDYTAKYT